MLNMLACTQSEFGDTKINEEIKITNETIITDETQVFVDEISKINVVMGAQVSSGGERPLQYDNFEALEAQASSEELIALTDHPNGVVRCYAFWALSLSDSVDLYSIVIDHIDDTARVETQFGCSVSYDRVGDFFINVVTPHSIDLEAQKLNEAQLAMLDSILLFEANFLSAKFDAMSSAEPTAALYPKFREMVIEENDQNALVQLAKYQKAQDIELILNYRGDADGDEDGYFYTYRAIAEFPHPRFLPLLKNNLEKTLDKTHYSNEWKGLYKAIVRYKNEYAVAMLQVPFTKVKHENIKGYHIDYVFKALEENQDPIYDDLLWRLWEEELRMTPSVYYYLKAKDSSRTFSLTKECLLNIDAFYGANMSFQSRNEAGSDSLISLMLDDVLLQDEAAGIMIIRKNILEANVHIYEIFTDHIHKLKDPSFVPPLFEQLEKEWNVHIYLEIVKALISYEDKAINQQILATIKINDNLTIGQGESALSRLLENNGIR